MGVSRSKKRRGGVGVMGGRDELELETERLVLRPPRAEDAAAVIDMMQDGFIYRSTLRVPYPYAKEHFEFYMNYAREGLQKDDALCLLIVLKETQEVLGNISLARKQYPLDVGGPYPIATVGYWLGKEFSGKGYCTEACKRIYGYAFQEAPQGWGLHKIVGSHFSFNKASGKVMEKVGMTKEAEYREHMWKDGVFHDSTDWGILRKDWIAHNEA